MSQSGDDRLLRDIYACAVGDEAWEAVLPRMAATVGGHALLLDRSAMPAGLSSRQSLNLDPELVQRYTDEVLEVDIYLHEFLRRYPSLDLGTTWNTDTLLPHKEVLSTRLHADYQRRLDVGRSIGAIVEPGDARLGTQATLMMLLRPLHSKPFDRADEARVATLWPHVARALRIERQLTTTRALDPAQLAHAAEAARRAPLAMVVVAADRRVLWLNEAAEDLLRRWPGLRRAGRLTAGTAAQATALDRALAACASPRGHAAAHLTLRLAGELGGGVIAHLAPPTAAAPVGAAAAVFLSPERPPPGADSRAFESLYGLTKAEAQVALALAGGQSLEAVAAQRGVSLTTVRSQLHAIFMKTGTGSQAQLQALLSAIPPRVP